MNVRRGVWTLVAAGAAAVTASVIAICTLVSETEEPWFAFLALLFWCGTLALALALFLALGGAGFRLWSRVHSARGGSPRGNRLAEQAPPCHQ